ncbi:MAG: DUF3631 domain-containing protein [Gammaproteobacteria bacterium]
MPTLTLLMDEGDTWIKLKPELRGILNSGHTRRGAFVIRVMSDGETRFSTWFPKCLALIDKNAEELPETVRDRSIVTPMVRKRRDESVVRLRADREADDLIELRMKAPRWVRDHFTRLRESDPPPIERISDRANDNWRPLLCVAQTAGDDWPGHAKESCLLLSDVIDETGELTVLLLADIRDAFTAEATDRIPSRVLVDKLGGIDERPWRSILNPFKLSQFLRPFHIRPKALWSTAETDRKRTLRGYFRADFDEAFSRYL